MLYFNRFNLGLLLIVALLICTDVTLAESNPPCSDDRNNLERANIYLEDGEYVRAVEAYTCAIQMGDEDAESYYERGVAFLSINLYEAALSDFERSYDLSPLSLGTQYYLGKAHFGLKQYDEALRYFNTVIKQAPDYPVTYSDRGITHFMLGDTEAGLADFNRIIELIPDHENGYVMRAWGYARLLDYENAAADLTLVLELNPDYGDRAFSGPPSVTVNQYLQAVANLASAEQQLAERPDNINQLIERGIAYSLLSDLKRASEDFNQAIALNPESAKAYYYRASLALYEQNHEAAITDYSTAINLKPDYAAAYFQRGSSYMRREEDEQAIEDFTRYLEGTPEPSPVVYLVRGYAYSLTGQDALAASDYLQYANGIRNTNFSRRIELDQPSTVFLETGSIYRFRFTAQAGQRLKFSAYSATENLPLDPLLILLDSEGTPLTGNDNLGRDYDLNAIIQNFEVPQDGEYVLMLTHSSGLRDGSVTVHMQLAR